LVLVTIEILVKHDIRELCYCQNVMVGNGYKVKLICRGYAEREGTNDDFD